MFDLFNNDFNVLLVKHYRLKQGQRQLGFVRYTEETLEKGSKMYLENYGSPIL